MFLLVCWLTTQFYYDFYIAQMPVFGNPTGTELLSRIHLVDILLGRNALLLILWLAMLAAPTRGELEPVEE